MKYIALLPLLGFFVFAVWSMQYIVPNGWFHRRILPMLKALIITLAALLILYGFFIFGLEYKDQQEIINYLKH